MNVSDLKSVVVAASRGGDSIARGVEETAKRADGGPAAADELSNAENAAITLVQKHKRPALCYVEQ